VDRERVLTFAPGLAIGCEPLEPAYPARRSIVVENGKLLRIEARSEVSVLGFLRKVGDYVEILEELVLHDVFGRNGDLDQTMHDRVLFLIKRETCIDHKRGDFLPLPRERFRNSTSYHSRWV